MTISNASARAPERRTRLGLAILAASLLAIGTIGAPTLTQTVMAVGCTPGYSPCIANKASDVDCNGGSGNGPRYTKRGVVYHVTGSDRYRLDADHDHWGCE
jgi:hypothetical protein